MIEQFVTSLGQCISYHSEPFDTSSKYKVIAIAESLYLLSVYFKMLIQSLSVLSESDGQFSRKRKDNFVCELVLFLSDMSKIAIFGIHF